MEASILRIRKVVGWLLAAVIISVSGPAAAQGRLTERSAGDRLADLGEMAKEGRWSEVGPQAQRFLDELKTSLVSKGGVGDESSQLAATVLSLLALAASAEGREEDALWHWSIAQSLWPDLSRATLTAYGEPAALLRSHRIDFARLGCAGRSDCAAMDGEEPVHTIGDHELQSPVKLEAPQPRYPFGARKRGHAGHVVVRTIIGTDGRVRQPLPIDYPSVALALAAVEALRGWRFEPARLNDRPVEVYYNLTVNFRLGR